MKKTLLTMIAILAMSANAMAQNIADLVGNYKGELYISLGEPISEETEVLNDQTITIAAGEGKAINFSLYNFTFGTAPLGDIIIENVGVKTEGNLVKFNDEAPVDLSFMNGGIKATAKINPETSQIEGDKILANLDVFWIQSAAMQMPIYVRFIGTKKVAAGIDGLSTDHAKTQQIYTLNGVRLQQSFDQLPKGIYIINGKKFVK